jgi:DNA-3-methyladenine glycosylase II
MSYLKQLRKDPVMLELTKATSIHLPEIRKPIFLELVYSIMSQQLSTTVADIIKKRFHELFRKKQPTPRDVLAIPFMELKKIGLSTSKTNYILNVCDFFIEHKVTDAKLHKMSDEELIEYLTSIKGVGKWTVEMVMMFAMKREDIFPVMDLGIQQSMIKHYKIRHKDNKQVLIERMMKISEQWQPYRTYASLFLWKSK